MGPLGEGEGLLRTRIFAWEVNGKQNRNRGITKQRDTAMCACVQLGRQVDVGVGVCGCVGVWVWVSGCVDVWVCGCGGVFMCWCGCLFVWVLVRGGQACK